jgi:hypothetical protein
LPTLIEMEIDMSNLASLADRYASLKNEIDALTKELDAAKKEILELGVEEVVGNFCTVTVGLSERSSLDQKKVKALLTPAQIAEVSSTTLITTVRVKAKVPVAA